MNTRPNAAGTRTAQQNKTAHGTARQKKNAKKVVLAGKSIDMTKNAPSTSFIPMAMGIALMVLAGIGTGYTLARTTTDSSSVSTSVTKTDEGETVIGSLEATFTDEAEGVLREGGIDGEGTHHLERPGGISQNVYLVSSVVPLDDFVDRKIKVWGETFDSASAGWFMDVGKLEVLE